MKLYTTLQNFIAAAEVVQVEVGPPVPGGHFAALFGPILEEDVVAMEVVGLQQLRTGRAAWHIISQSRQAVGPRSLFTDFGAMICRRPHTL